jgi:PBP1b-binding outer membrane lipoprotein LpoB
LNVYFKERSMKFLIPILILSFILYGCVQPTSTEASVDGNNEPVINDVSIEPLLIRVGSSTTITVDATDPDGDFLSYSWAVALGDIIGSGNQVRYTAAFCCVGINTVNLVVTDSRGASVSHSINLEVSP